MQAATRRIPAFPLAAFQALCLYGSAAITLGGWGVSRLLGFPWGSYAPLWFAGALLVYNVDRLKPDPADDFNTPLRQAVSERLRPLSRMIILGAALVLVGFPLSRGDWLMLFLTATGGAVCACYSLPSPGFRLKDIPVLKTFFAPTIVTAAFLVPPLIQTGMDAAPLTLAFAALWIWLFLCFNMILCDLRDIGGDRRTSTRTFPVALGESRTARLLAALVPVTFLLGVLVSVLSSSGPAAAWRILIISTAAFEISLLSARTRHRSESFYEWWVEGLLFLPAVAVWLAG